MSSKRCTVPRTALCGPGRPRFRGRVVALTPCHWSGMLNTAESADFLKVRATTIRQWRFKGWLEKQGLDERNRPLHTVQALREAEALVTRHGIEASGVNPRTLRGKAATRVAKPENDLEKPAPAFGNAACFSSGHVRA
jgi:hypothetical protein